MTVAVLVVSGQPAFGQDGAAAADDVAAAIARVGWYADDDAVGDREQLTAVAQRLSRASEPIGFAVLTVEPSGTSTAFAERVLGRLVSHGEHAIRTVVVLSDADVGVVSDAWSDDAIDAALDDTIDKLRANRTDGLEALADALAVQRTGFDDKESDGGYDAGLALLVVAVLVVGLAIAVRGRRLEGGVTDGEDDSGWSGRRRSFYRSRRSRSRSRSFSSGGSRRSSGGSRRGRGGRRL